MEQMQGAIFDMDGVLFDTERLYQENWRAVAKERGITLPPEFTYAVSGASKANVDAAVKKFYRTDEPESVIAEVYGRMQLRQESPLPIKPGVVAFLSFLKERHVKVAVASSTYQTQVEKNLERNGLREYFEIVIGGDSVTHAKPDPEIFFLAAERLSLPPERCFVFEDSYNGIRAAHAASCKAVMVIDLMQPDEEVKGLASYIFPDMESAEEALRGEFASGL